MPISLTKTNVSPYLLSIMPTCQRVKIEMMGSIL